MKLTEDQAKRLANAFDNLDSSDPVQLATSLREIISILQNARGGVKGVDDETEKLIRSLIKAANEALTVANNARQIEPGLNAATGAANSLTAALAKSAAAANSVIARQQVALKLAQARVQFAGDNIGFAGAAAGIQFDAAVPQQQFSNPKDAAAAESQLLKQRDASIELAQETKKATIEAEKLNKELAKKTPNRRWRFITRRWVIQ